MSLCGISLKSFLTGLVSTEDQPCFLLRNEGAFTYNHVS
jgi:hypothetical protein